MQAEKEEAPVNTVTESKLVKIMRRIFISVAVLGFLFLFYKMAASKWGG